ncbi:Aste57867_21700 [Aphanomyces stellatus]|uniref:Aste57867_21700 protein n=1 Tax=Aphanomyces stellatus TaxID=120398 RepID=A0A485LIX0_9STRA|nr:hypothetical protein As57867_021631 [Aphanomyces stellatus]VFT98369.1 Aste57867_21700 [Aphanomyces stellatus]
MKVAHATTTLAVLAGSLCAASVFLYTRRKKDSAVRYLTLADLKAHPQWVSLCGIVFAVDPHLLGPDGVYGDIGGHDATTAFCGRMYTGDSRTGDAAIADALELDREIDAPLTDDEAAALHAWIATFQAKFSIVGYLSDLFSTSSWDSFRTHGSRDGSTAAMAPRCPMGFGTRRPSQMPPTIDASSSSSKHWIIFSGTRYDVSDAPSFAKGSPFAIYVGHDITYALAIGSRDERDLDVPLDGDHVQLTFGQQKAVAQYRQAFDASFRVIERIDDRPDDANRR